MVLAFLFQRPLVAFFFAYHIIRTSSLCFLRLCHALSLAYRQAINVLQMPLHSTGYRPDGWCTALLPTFVSSIREMSLETSTSTLNSYGDDGFVREERYRVSVHPKLSMLIHAAMILRLRGRTPLCSVFPSRQAPLLMSGRS